MERQTAESALADALGGLLERIDTSRLVLDGVRPVYVGLHSQHSVLRARAVLTAYLNETGTTKENE